VNGKASWISVFAVRCVLLAWFSTFVHGHRLVLKLLLVIAWSHKFLVLISLDSLTPALGFHNLAIYLFFLPSFRPAIIIWTFLAVLYATNISPPIISTFRVSGTMANDKPRSPAVKDIPFRQAIIH
jgi:hypothetical protein